MNNLLIGPDAQARFVLQNLSNFQGKGAIKGVDTPVIEGVQFSNDPEADVRGDFVSKKGEMLSVRMKPKAVEKPRWQALHFHIGGMDLSKSLLVGLAIKSRAPSSTSTRIALRSGKEGKFVDFTLPKTLVSYADESVHLDVFELDAYDDLPRQAEWRDLVFFFRSGEVELDLLDIRLFTL